MTETPKPESGLLPCPFCGGEADREDGWTYCLECGVGYEDHENIERSDHLWNSRAALSADTEALTILRESIDAIANPAALNPRLKAMWLSDLDRILEKRK